MFRLDIALDYLLFLSIKISRSICVKTSAKEIADERSNFLADVLFFVVTVNRYFIVLVGVI